jgi:hypothetical protein
MQLKKNEKGFSVVELLVILIVVAGIAVAGYYVYSKHSNKNVPKSSAPVSLSAVTWMSGPNGWQVHGTPPACSTPLRVDPPTDVSLATGILYPGQYRGGNYKPHGGFRFNNNTNDKINVSLPMDAKLYKGSRYIEQGETQYLLVFINPCGIMFKFDHLYTLAPKYQKIVDENFPPAQENNSETTNLTKDIETKAGDPIATGVGFKKTGNTTFDFGVYDLRSRNTISKNSAWANLHKDDQEYAPYAVCWLNLLPAADAAKVKALPAADSVSGAISDYCTTSAGNTLTNTVGNPSAQAAQQSAQSSATAGGGSGQGTHSGPGTGGGGGGGRY